jgi:monofunctional biosynthetic peptidoglycan transglycosylase
MAAPSPQRRPRRWLRIVARVVEGGVFAVALGTLLLWCSLPNTARLANRNPTSTAFIDLRRSEAAAAGKPFDLKWTWRPIGKISRYLRQAVIDAEDANFYRHDGVDWDAIEKAVDKNLARGSLAVGGSTITQQLAKNLYLSPSRSFLRKLREMLIAFSLEDHLTKQRILELYLNVVEWGDGVFGAEAAAQRWFGHSAQSLSPAEAVRLAIALPNPLQRSPEVRSELMTDKAVRLIRMLRWRGLIDSAQERTALDAVGARHVKVQPFRDRSDEVDADPLPPDVPASPPGAPSSPAAEPVTAPDRAPVTHPEPSPGDADAVTRPEPSRDGTGRSVAPGTTDRLTLPSP